MSESTFQSAVRRGAFDGLTAAGERRRIVLPFPPSVNTVFRKHNGKHLSAAYRAWRDEAGWMLKQQNPLPSPGLVAVTVELVAPDKRVRDADNRLKPVLDLLVTHGVIDGDDSLTVRSVTARWIEAGNPCTVIVEPVR